MTEVAQTGTKQVEEWLTGFVDPTTAVSISNTELQPPYSEPLYFESYNGNIHYNPQFPFCGKNMEGKPYETYTGRSYGSTVKRIITNTSTERPDLEFVEVQLAAVHSGSSYRDEPELYPISMNRYIDVDSGLWASSTTHEAGTYLYGKAGFPIGPKVDALLAVARDYAAVESDGRVFIIANPKAHIPERDFRVSDTIATHNNHDPIRANRKAFDKLALQYGATKEGRYIKWPADELQGFPLGYSGEVHIYEQIAPPRPAELDTALAVSVGDVAIHRGVEVEVAHDFGLQEDTELHPNVVAATKVYSEIMQKVADFALRHPNLFAGVKAAGEFSITLPDAPIKDGSVARMVIAREADGGSKLMMQGVGLGRSATDTGFEFVAGIDNQAFLVGEGDDKGASVETDQYLEELASAAALSKQYLAVIEKNQLGRLVPAGMILQSMVPKPAEVQKHPAGKGWLKFLLEVWRS